MSGLNYLSEREWAVYTIETELQNLERMVSAREAFSVEELTVLRRSLARLNQIMSDLDEDAGEDGLPAWLQRKPAISPTGSSKSGQSAA